MADFHVVHASHERCPKASDRFHVAAIGTADSALDSRNWTVIEVLHAMGRGDRFYVERRNPTSRCKCAASFVPAVWKLTRWKPRLECRTILICSI